ncbi:CHASE2 domain-containing protein [Deinococcus sp. Marseille-Q6407]|uniref:CHASE2 domain-containing protein n=1 Tax=Deinococcus sp. Marseille-Q6407 TaxID=2969223 RepID=UPI0021C0AA29|nr:CHASE2 domain-containing protein [Deinococcus sp. Marseille-Q6407]
MTSLRNPRRWWQVPGRHASWPYLLLAGLVLGGLLGVVWPANPAAWSLASQAFPRPGGQVVLVDLDAASLADYGPLNSWSPELYRSAAEQLQQAGASAVGLDVVLDPARRETAPLVQALTHSGVVLAAPTPDSAAQPGYGFSAVNSSRLLQPYAFQTAYPTAQGKLVPSLAWRLAQAAGASVPLESQPRLLHRFVPSALDTRLSFRDVVAGRFPHGDVQGKVALIGQASPDPERLPGSELQARAAASLLAPPFLNFPGWAVGLMAALIAGLSVVLGRFWGLAQALLLPALMLLLWRAGVALPGVTLSLAALTGLLLVGAEALLVRRSARLHSSVNEQMLGTRAGLSQAVETLLAAAAPDAGRPCLFLVELEGYAALQQRFGVTLAEEAVDQSLQRLLSLAPVVPRLEGFGFRWDRGELVFIVDPVQSETEAREIADYFALTVSGVVLRGQSLLPRGGYAWVRKPEGLALDEVSAHSLVGAARQTLRPVVEPLPPQP